MTYLTLPPVNQVVPKAIQMHEQFVQEQSLSLKEQNTQKPVKPGI